MKGKLFALLLTLLCILNLAACTGQQSGSNKDESLENTIDNDTKEPEFTPLVTIDDVEIHEEIINGQPCFWITNNSEYTLVGVVYVKAVDIVSDKYAAAYAGEDFYKPGESSEVVPFYITDDDSKSAAIPDDDSVVADAEDVNAASAWSIEFGYQNDIAMENFEPVKGAVDEWVQYSFVSDSYRGFSYIDELEQLEEALNKYIEPEDNPNEHEFFTIDLVAGEAGEYGKPITFNKGTEFEETFYAYYIPAGVYTVTNVDDYMGQVSVYNNEIHVTEEGWEEPDGSGDVALLDVGESTTITIEDNQYVEIHEPNHFRFEAQ